MEPGTVKRYLKATQAFLTWMLTMQITFTTALWGLDDILSHDVEHLWEEGEGPSLANDTFAGMLHYRPRFSNYLPTTRKMLKAWRKRELPARSPPFTTYLLFALCECFISTGEGGCAIGCLLMFFLILRTGEMGNIKKGDISFSPNLNGFVLSLGFTKASGRRGTEGSVVCEDPWLVAIVAAWARDRMPGDPLLPRGLVKFMKSFSDNLRRMEVESHGFKPYSLRRGGATLHFRKYNSPPKTTVYGRWASARTSRIYINEGLAISAKQNLESAKLKAWAKAALTKMRASPNFLLT